MMLLDYYRVSSSISSMRLISRSSGILGFFPWPLCSSSGCASLYRSMPFSELERKLPLLTGLLRLFDPLPFKAEATAFFPSFLASCRADGPANVSLLEDGASRLFDSGSTELAFRSGRWLPDGSSLTFEPILCSVRSHTVLMRLKELFGIGVFACSEAFEWFCGILLMTWADLYGGLGSSSLGVLMFSLRGPFACSSSVSMISLLTKAELGCRYLS